MSILDEFKEFDLDKASSSLWVFRKTQKKAPNPPSYRGSWIAINQELDTAIKTSIDEKRKIITETIEYDLLAQNNEASALTITTIETYGGMIVDAANDSQDPKSKCKNEKGLRNIDFYVFRMFSEGKTIYAIRKANSSWGSKTTRNFLNAVFKDETLGLQKEPSFSVSKYFDFFIFGETILILDKNSFEQILSYKAGHEKDFTEMKAELDFSNIFSEMSAIDAYVGSNRMQLRRASAIRQKGNYKNASYMDALRKNYNNAQLNISFDDAGRIIPSPETCPDIFQALLDHRLTSIFSNKNYDVQSTKAV